MNFHSKPELARAFLFLCVAARDRDAQCLAGTGAEVPSRGGQEIWTVRQQIADSLKVKRLTDDIAESGDVKLSVCEAL